MTNVRSRPIASVFSMTLVLAVILAACGGGAASSPASSPTQSAASSLTESPGQSPGQSPGRSPGQAVTTPQQAAERVGQTDQRFLGIPEQTAAMIGASAWWTWDPIENGGFRITFTSGWGDCQAGCISEHNWNFEVTAAGAVTLVDESGDPLSGGVTQ